MKNINANCLEEYNKNFRPINPEINDPEFTELQKKLEKEISTKYSSEFLIISILYNIISLIIKIIRLKTENGNREEIYLVVGLLISYITICIIGFILKIKKRLKTNLNYLTSMSYMCIYIDYLIFTFLLVLSKEITPEYPIQIYLSDFNLVLSSFLMILSCESKFVLQHKFFINMYYLSIFGLILFRGVATYNSSILISLVTLFALLVCVIYITKRKSNHLEKKFVKTSTENQIKFNQMNSITNALNAGFYLFRKEELFFSNETGRKIIREGLALSSNRISYDNSQNSLNGIKPADEKIHLSDSIANLDSVDCEKKFSHNVENGGGKSSPQEQVRLLFEKIVVYEGAPKIIEIMGKVQGREEFSNLEEISEIKSPKDDFPKIHETKFNLNEIFSFLNKAESNCLSEHEEYLKLGIFELKLDEKQSTYYEIMTQVHNNISRDKVKGDRVIEFIFKDVTLYYDLLSKVQTKDLNFKKNAHEFKTPILSLLGCAEELKEHIVLIEDKLDRKVKMKINNCLDHVTNLSSYIGYLIKGLTKANNEVSNCNSVVEYKAVRLNPLMNFCLKILQTLVSCDSQKSKQVKTKLINDVINFDVSFCSDEIQVKQILLNFISNAVKFTKNGSIALEVRINKETERDVLEIIVKDSGCGIKQEDNKKLFTEYAKFDNTVNNTFGTGLGLNICKTMADKMNMKIDFNSEENKGTRVSLLIFNPVIQEKEKLDSSIKMRIDDDDDMGDEIRFKKTIPNLRKSSQILLMRDNTLCRVQNKNNCTLNSFRSPRLQSSNEEKCESNDEYLNKSNQTSTVRNPPMARLNRSQLSIVLNSSINSDMDSMDQTPTRRLGKDHVYDFIEKEMDGSLDENSKQISKVSLTEKLDHQIPPLLTVNNVPQSSKILTKFNQDLLKSDRSECRINEIKSKILSMSSNSFRSMKSKTNELSLKEKIIIVDDQMHSRKALVNITSKYCKENKIDYEILEECDGIDCLKTIINYPFLIKYVFIDENMNYMNGTEAAAIIKKLYKQGKVGQINLILTSADDNVKYEHDLFDFCVTKPLVRKNIEEVIQQK